MEQTIIDKIIQKKMPCFFISPHFDDAILSAGALLVYLSKYTEVTVINVFTKAGEKPYSLSAKQYLKQCGYTDAQKLYHDRRQEDRAVLGKLVKRSINLGFTDALWRKKEKVHLLGKYIPEFNYIYPTYKFHIIKGNVSKLDTGTLSKIASQLSLLIDKKTALVFCPAGIGNHVDHRIVNIVCSALFEKILYWSDFPYDEKSTSQKVKVYPQTLTFSQYLKEKSELIKGYKTQFTAMFKNGIPTKPEKYYTFLTPNTL